MFWFHVTLSLGRSDSLILEADSKSDILTFFNSVSVAVVSSIKKIVYSKEVNVNHIQKVITKELYYKKIIVCAKSKTKAKMFELYNIKKTITKDIILTQFKKLNIDNEPIEDIYNVLFID